VSAKAASAATSAAPSQEAQILALKKMVELHVKTLQGIASSIVKSSKDCKAVEPLLENLEDKMGEVPEGFEEKLFELQSEGRDLIEAYAHVAMQKTIHAVIDKVERNVAHCFEGNEEGDSEAAGSHDGDVDKLTLPDMLKGDDLKKMSLKELSELLSRLDKVHNLMEKMEGVAQKTVDSKEEAAAQSKDVKTDASAQEAPLKKQEASTTKQLSADQKQVAADKQSIKEQQDLIKALEARIKQHEQKQKQIDQQLVKDQEKNDHDADVKKLIEAQINAIVNQVKSSIAAKK
jgi:hypothetical protein